MKIKRVVWGRINLKNFALCAGLWWKLHVFSHNDMEVLRWIALDASTDEPCVVHFCHCRVRSDLAVGFTKLTKYVNAKDMSWNSSEVDCQEIFLSFENFQARFHSLLCIFLYSNFLHSHDFRFRTGETRIYTAHFVFVWITHYSLRRGWVMLISITQLVD